MIDWQKTLFASFLYSSRFSPLSLLNDYLVRPKTKHLTKLHISDWHTNCEPCPSSSFSDSSHFSYQNSLDWVSKLMCFLPFITHRILYLQYIRIGKKLLYTKHYQIYLCRTTLSALSDWCDVLHVLVLKYIQKWASSSYIFNPFCTFWFRLYCNSTQTPYFTIKLITRHNTNT